MTQIMSVKKRKRNSPAWEAHGEMITAMRRDGYPLQVIGDEIGVSRERIRQLLERHGQSRTSLLTRDKAAEVIGCSRDRLSQLERRGIVKPKRRGHLFIYDREEMEKAMLALPRNCPHCGEPLPLKRRGEYCSKCKRNRERYSYPFMSDEGKRRHNKYVRAWIRRNPERYKITQERAQRAYRERWKRENYATAQYVVFRGRLLPTGSVFRAVRCENSHLILEDGARIPISHVRKVENE